MNWEKRREEVINDKEKYHFKEALFDLGDYTFLNILNWQQLLEVGNEFGNCLSKHSYDMYKDKYWSKIKKGDLKVLVLENKKTKKLEVIISYDKKKKRIEEISRGNLGPIDPNSEYFKTLLEALNLFSEEISKIRDINYNQFFLDDDFKILDDEVLTKNGVKNIKNYSFDKDGLIFYLNKNLILDNSFSEDKILELAKIKQNINFDFTEINSDLKMKIEKWGSNIIDRSNQFSFLNLREVGDLLLNNIQDLESDKIIYAKNIFLERVKNISLSEIKKISSLSAIQSINLNLPNLKEVEAFCWINSVKEYDLSSLKRVGDLKNFKIKNFYLPKLNYFNKFVLAAEVINLPELETINHSLLAQKSDKIILPKIRRINKFISVNKNTKVDLSSMLFDKIERKEV